MLFKRQQVESLRYSRLKICVTSAKAAGGTGETEADTWTEIPDALLDVVIMNPPFTRSTGQEAKKIGVPQPMFAAFSTTKQDQALMAKATKRLTAGTSAHGNAGEASFFLVLADRKVRPDGILALVMPLSLMSGEAWEASRRMLAKHYSDLVLISIAAPSDNEMSFSADTGMGECLLIGRKSGAAWPAPCWGPLRSWTLDAVRDAISLSAAYSS